MICKKGICSEANATTVVSSTTLQHLADRKLAPLVSKSSIRALDSRAFRNPLSGFPLRAIRTRSNAPRKEQSPKRGATLARTVLVVDDSPIVRRTVSSALQSDGFAVCGQAKDGQEAIELAGRLSPDVIILDLSMPVMNGLQAAPLLRKLVPKSPIILYTLYAGEAVEKELGAIEVDSVLSKREPLSRLTAEARALLGE